MTKRVCEGKIVLFGCVQSSDQLLSFPDGISREVSLNRMVKIQLGVPSDFQSDHSQQKEARLLLRDGFKCLVHEARIKTFFKKILRGCREIDNSSSVFFLYGISRLDCCVYPKWGGLCHR